MLSARRRFLPPLLLALILGSACTDEPAGPAIGPEQASLARAGKGAPPHVTVMTRNLYLGADFARVLQGDISTALTQVSTTYFPLRVPALLAEIAEVGPDLIGMQEVTRYEFTGGCPLGEATIDYAEILASQLGVLYEAYYAPNLSVPVPAYAGCTITYTDGDMILVRRSPRVEVHASGMDHFAQQVTLPGPFYPLQNLRGYQWVDVSVEGHRFHFVNTHLEVQQPPAWGATQEQQAAELLEVVDGFGGPVVMVGDFNSAANPDAPAESRTATYPMILDAGFDDLWLRHRGRFTTDGLTCCQYADLSNPEPDLDQRLDLVFARNVPSGAGYAGQVDMGIVGNESADVFTAFNPLLGFEVSLWPSDHAGVFATLRMPPGLMADR